MDVLILSNALLIPVVFLIGIAVGYFIGIRRAFKDIKDKVMPVFEKKIVNKLKVLRKSEPKTYTKKQVEALEKNKPIIKTFYK